VPAVYVALSRATAIAEGRHLVELQPLPMKGIRHVHRARVKLGRVLDLRDSASLATLGLSEADIQSSDLTACQRVGGTAEWLGIEGLIVPSARDTGANLVIFERRTPDDFEVTVLDSEPVDGGGDRALGNPGP
jgi:RES domain-containing protein